MSKQTISISIWFFAAVALLFAIIAVAIDARAQADPEPTAQCWTVDGQLVCIGPGPVAVTATPTAAPIAPTVVPTATPEWIRPMNICAHPLWTCVRLPIVVRDAEVTGGVR